MILGVEEAFLLISLEFMHAAATDGAGRGLVASSPLCGLSVWQAWASLQHGVSEF